MRRSLIAGVVIVGWIALSGIDLLEDFTPFCGPVLEMDRAADAGATPRNGAGACANNIVESANRAPAAVAAFHVSDVLAGAGATAGDFRGYFLRHKLYRVYLI